MNHEREQRFDFSHPFHNSGLGIAVGASERRGWSALLAAIVSRTFLQLLSGLCAVLVFVGVAVYFFERKRILRTLVADP